MSKMSRLLLEYSRGRVFRVLVGWLSIILGPRRSIRNWRKCSNCQGLGIIRERLSTLLSVERMVSIRIPSKRVVVALIAALILRSVFVLMPTGGGKSLCCMLNKNGPLRCRHNAYRSVIYILVQINYQLFAMVARHKE